MDDPRDEMKNLLNSLQNWETKLLRAERMKSDLSLARKRYERAVIQFDQGRREFEVARRMGPRVSIIRPKKKSSAAE